MLASQNFSWFSPSKSNKPVTHTPAVVTTRTILAPKPKYRDPLSFAPLPRVPVGAPPVSPTPKKRKRVQEHGPDHTSHSSMTKEKKQRVESDPERRVPPAKRVRTPSKASASSSNAASPKPSRSKRAVSAVPTRLVNGFHTPDRTRSPSARSRSTTDFGSLEGPIPRECWTTHDGAFGEDLTSAETVVKKLMHSYKSCECMCGFTCINLTLFRLQKPRRSQG